MDRAAKRFASFVLAIHVLLLLLVAAMVFAAAHQVYVEARQQAIDQAIGRQTLLAEQTARGIESYYQSIVDTLELLQRIPGSQSAQDEVFLTPRLLMATRGVLAPAVWQQLKNRAKFFFVVDRTGIADALILPTTERDHGLEYLNQGVNWLKDITEPSISPLMKVGDDYVHFVCVPNGAKSRLLFVAVVPVENINTEFLSRVHAQKHMSAMLMDQTMHVLTSDDKRIVGLSVIDNGSGGDNVREIAMRYIQQGLPGTEVFLNPFKLGQHQFASGLVSVYPVHILGKTWWLSIGTDLSEVDAILEGTVRKTVLWAIFLFLAMLAILASTSVFLIRSRVRTERMRHEVLTRELEQARKIQLAWLPRNDQDPPEMDFCAVNRPASHISGDFYNWFLLADGRVCVVIGDVTGHGMAAAFLMATTQLLVQMIMPRAADTGKCMEAVNNQLAKQVFSGQFVTMQIMIFDRLAGKVEITSAGHPPPLWKRGNAFEAIDVEPQLVLGIELNETYASQTYDIPHDAEMVLYTDGVIEAKSPDGDWLGIERLCASLEAQYSNAQTLADGVLGIVDRFRGPLDLADDLTLIAIFPHAAAKRNEKSS